MIKLLRLKIDSRDLSFHEKFGQVTDFPTNLEFDTNIPDVIQQPGDVRCTCLTICDIATDLTGVLYDVDELYSRVPHSQFGADPRDAIKEAIDNGLKRLDNGQIEKPFSSYWKAHTGQFDAFDNVRSALEKSQRGIALWSPWFYEWLNKVRLPIGKTAVSNHMYEIEGVKIADDKVVVLIIEAWLGFKLEIDRDTFNWLMENPIASTAVLSDSSIDAKRKKSILEKIRDALLNIVEMYKQLLIMKNVDKPIPTPPQSDIIKVMDKSQRFYELCYNLIGKHLTLDTSVPSIYGCAEAVSYALKEFGYPIPARGYASTNELYKWLHANCDEVDTPSVGDIIISVSYTGIKGARGHVGTVGKKAIMSNDSESGLWQPFWSMAGWLKHFKDDLKLTTKYFRLK